MTERHKLIPSSYLIFIKDNKIALLKRCNTGFKDGYYSLIAGHVESNETFTDAAIREGKEEADIHLHSDNLELIHMMHRLSSENGQERIDAFFLIKNWEGKIKNMEPEKCDDLSWFDMDNLPNNIIPYIKDAIKHIQDKKHYSEYGWTEEEL